MPVHVSEFSLQPLSTTVQVLFPPMLFGLVAAGGWLVRLQEKACLCCVSETMRCKMLILGRDIGWVMLVCSVMVSP